jgi:hypothetical protein
VSPPIPLPATALLTAGERIAQQMARTTATGERLQRARLPAWRCSPTPPPGG